MQEKYLIAIAIIWSAFLIAFFVKIILMAKKNDTIKKIKLETEETKEETKNIEVQSENMKKFLSLVSPEKSDIHEIMQWRKENRKWLKHSFLIAIKILVFLDKENISIDKFSELSGIEKEEIKKILKGSENMTIETISKIEEALQIKIINNEKE